jgi:hypothetical protein
MLILTWITRGIPPACSSWHCSASDGVLRRTLPQSVVVETHLGLRVVQTEFSVHEPDVPAYGAR